MSSHEAQLEEHRRLLMERLQRDHDELRQAAQALRPRLRALDRAEQRLRIAADALPVIAWALAELLLAAVAVRRLRNRQGGGWISLGVQAWRAWHFLRDSVRSS